MKLILSLRSCWWSFRCAFSLWRWDCWAFVYLLLEFLYEMFPQIRKLVSLLWKTEFLYFHRKCSPCWRNFEPFWVLNFVIVYYLYWWFASENCCCILKQSYLLLAFRYIIFRKLKLQCIWYYFCEVADEPSVAPPHFDFEIVELLLIYSLMKYIKNSNGEMQLLPLKFCIASCWWKLEWHWDIRDWLETWYL